MSIVHIVLFEFKPTTDSAVIQDVCKRMLALRQKCIHPTTKQPYMVENSGGRDNSPEGHQGGFSHGFVAHFKNEEDRRYYLEEDPAHLEFVASLKDIIQNVRVVDYSPGVF
ncbi:uncharacterized protein RCO7_01083 [Rhynchosporium graminicola]|uniref:Stress-response A/B barrel domain-containing protein n=1 Tax=Rhynchosporium graminicola TaxID=2792576 RepID=A0A1E1JQL2_9HELO|nr:uncharacterized protein RCO7_01083 [Rhynchosporium commune]